MATTTEERVAALNAFATRKVRSVAERESEDRETLLIYLYDRREDWDLTAWNEALAELDRSDLSVREWVALEEHNRRTSHAAP